MKKFLIKADAIYDELDNKYSRRPGYSYWSQADTYDRDGKCALHFAIISSSICFFLSTILLFLTKFSIISDCKDCRFDILGSFTLIVFFPTFFLWLHITEKLWTVKLKRSLPF